RDIDRKLDSGTDAEQLRSEIERLEKLESELNTVEVPLSYYHELYELHL
ncbi:C4-dicarboxylate ABC transporter substrate-binding protein, partial [Escherichia coli]|nr:C4-dicarboxylate ABC transporter substrate-binding protein [Escherichia coli]